MININPACYFPYHAVHPGALTTLVSHQQYLLPALPARYVATEQAVQARKKCTKDEKNNHIPVDMHMPMHMPMHMKTATNNEAVNDAFSNVVNKEIPHHHVAGIAGVANTNYTCLNKRLEIESKELKHLNYVIRVMTFPDESPEGFCMHIIVKPLVPNIVDVKLHCQNPGEQQWYSQHLISYDAIKYKSQLSQSLRHFCRPVDSFRHFGEQVDLESDEFLLTTLLYKGTCLYVELRSNNIDDNDDVLRWHNAVFCFSD